MTREREERFTLTPQQYEGLQHMGWCVENFGRHTEANFREESEVNFEKEIHKNLFDELGLPLDPLWRLYVLEKALWVSDLLPIQREKAINTGEDTSPWIGMGYEQMARNLYGSWYAEWQDDIHPQDCDLGYSHIPKPRPFSKRYRFRI